MTVVATVFLCLAPEIALSYPDSLCWNVRDNRRIHVKASPIVLLFSAILVTAAPASALSLIQFEPVANICRAERDEPAEHRCVLSVPRARRDSAGGGAGRPVEEPRRPRVRRRR